MNKLRSEINERMVHRRRPSIDKKVNSSKSNPENELFKRK